MNDKFNMVDMGGIDLAEVNGNVVDGLFEKISESVSNCRFQILYNWKFAGIQIPPTSVETTIEDGVAVINEFISINSSDVVTIASLIIEPVLESLLCTSNGVNSPPEGVNGWNLVTVEVAQNAIILNHPPTSDIGVDGQYCIVETYSTIYDFGFTLTTLGRDTDYSFNYWGTQGIVFVFEDAEGNEVDSNTLAVKHGWWAWGTSEFQSQDGIVSGNLNSYYEHSGKPGYFKVQFDVPLGYKIKKIKVAIRINSAYHDFWRTFSLDQWVGNYQSVLNILSEENLVWGDWNRSGFTEFVLTEPVEPIPLPITHLYKKAAGNWVLIN